MLLQFIINGLISGLLYGLLALAFSLGYNSSKVFHICYAGVLVIASYIFYTFYNIIGLNFVFSILFSLLFAGILNLLIEKFIYQELFKRKAKLNNILVASIGVFIVLINTISLLYSSEEKSIGIKFGNSLRYNSIILTQVQIIQFIVGLVLITFILLLINYTSLGLKIKAISNNALLYKIMGHSARKTSLLLFFISGCLAGIISLLYSFDVGFNPYFGMNLLLNSFVAMVIGGFGSFKGSVFGGIILGLVQGFSIFYFESKWEIAISFFILILFLIFRPQGIFGEKQRLI